MNTLKIVLLLIVMAGMAAPTPAVSGNDNERGKKRRAQVKRGSGVSHEQLLKKYDKNGDGKLDEQERAAVRKEADKSGKRGRHSRMLKKFDTDGDGQLNEAERAVMRKNMKKRKEAHDGGKIN